ncbi:MAG: chloramphenicol acetyltransferase [Azospirillum sp.]|nr:chloramphenicol acetyltransferase [Azospirillum sp.]
MPGDLLSEAPTVHPSAVVEDCRLGRWTEIGARVTMIETGFGDYSYVCQDSQIIYAEIGRFCSLASQVRLNPGNHPLDRAALHHFTYRSRQFGLGDDDDAAFFAWRRGLPVRLGHDVWVGHNATLMPGVSVGTGAAIGSGAVVTHDVPAFTVVAGVPAKPIRARFAPALQAALLRIAWWDWDQDRLRAGLADFRRLDAAAFCRKYDSA